MKDDLLMGGLGTMPKVDPLDYDTIKCSKCGGIVFKPAYILKSIPGPAIGHGIEPVTVPLQVFVCNNCNEILESDKKELKLDKNELNKSNIIT